MGIIQKVVIWSPVLDLDLVPETLWGSLFKTGCFAGSLLPRGVVTGSHASSGMNAHFGGGGGSFPRPKGKERSKKSGGSRSGPYLGKGALPHKYENVSMIAPGLPKAVG